MPDRRTGLRRKIWIAFILQAAAISFAAVLGVYGASAVLKHVLTKPLAWGLALSIGSG